MILGIDEAGRGPWAGPLVVGAVVLGGVQIDGLTDSKKLSKKKREMLYDQIYKNALSVGLGWVTAGELDEIGMSAALKLATVRAVSAIKCSYSEIIIDGTVNFLCDTGKGKYVKTMPKADLLIPSVSAASIIAKVARDRYMTDQDVDYPEYGFKNHSGYGVAAHREAISKYGVTPLHRLSFAPLRKYSTDTEIVTEDSKKSSIKTTRSIGNISEDLAAKYLQKIGHTIIERNWRTKWCEIDIVSTKDKAIYFTEVKHRRNQRAGGGLAAITPKKLRQMKFAAELYSTKYQQSNLYLAVVTTRGDSPAIEDYLEIL